MWDYERKAWAECPDRGLGCEMLVCWSNRGSAAFRAASGKAVAGSCHPFFCPETEL